MAKSSKNADQMRLPSGNLEGQRPPASPATSPQLRELARQWLTVQEAKGIDQQFRRSFIRNRQVLWSGMLRSTAQRWADQHGFQTLTTALGPLLDPSHPKCPNKEKSPKGWAKYIHGASVIFAWHISQGDLVTVLSQPPPQRFHPSGQSFYQSVEEPIVKGKLGNTPVKKIVVVHPTVVVQATPAHPSVVGVAEFSYEMWPRDERSLWIKKFGTPDIVIYWRPVKAEKPKHSDIGGSEQAPSKHEVAKPALKNKEGAWPNVVSKKKKKKKKKATKSE
ncbi:hypothetical protein FZEAL_4399 [Fusarium zealandicum]|uniref:Uncharacterized protein n=1 Tax=Fusarium zealandicum TaxID=1053134 RepID=A0A8H4XKV0_9HYPO|nr:hypothetical protein FZEAL_4399 [Fusarium zealandicum]